MKIQVGNVNISAHQKAYQELLKGEVRKVAANQVNKVNDVNFKGTRENHRISFQYNKELGRNVAHIIDNLTGKTVKKAISDAEIDKMIRIERLKGMHLDEKV